MKYIQYSFLLLLCSCLVFSSNELKPPAIEDRMPLFAEHIEAKIDPSPMKINVPPAKYNSINAKIDNIEKSSSIAVSDAPIVSEVTLDNEIIILASNGNLSRIRKSGEQVWSKYFVGDIKYGSIAHIDDNIILSTGTTKLFNIDADSGDIIWEKTLQAPIHTKPLHINLSNILIMTIDNYLYSIDVKDASLQWSYQIKPPALQRINKQMPVYYYKRDSVVLPVIDNEITALNAADGKVLWGAGLNTSYRESVIYSSYDTPVILNDLVIIANYVGAIEAFDINSGKKKWQQYISFYSKPFILDEVMFAITEHNQLVAVNKEGKVKWKASIDDKVNWYGPILANNLLWIFNDQGKAYGYKVKSGEKVDNIGIPHGLSHLPFVIEGSLYSFDKNGKLLIIGEK